MTTAKMLESEIENVPEPADDTPHEPDHVDPLVNYLNVNELREEGATNTCLRPLGLCELGGCCNVCIYNPDNRKRLGWTR